jgi:hypothetical protein
MVRVPTAKVADKWSITFSGPDYVTKLKGFDAIFQEQLKAVSGNLLKGAVGVARDTLNTAETPLKWGRSRMRGERNGITFKPYGNSVGRNRTGFMINSLDWKIEDRAAGRNTFQGKLGWFPERTKGKDGYIRDQEYGFKNFSRFDRYRTLKTGVASFVNVSKPLWTPGAKSLPAARKSLSNRAPAGFQAAWNEAVVQWKSAGFKTNPGSFKAARNRYARFGRV